MNKPWERQPGETAKAYAAFSPLPRFAGHRPVRRGCDSQFFLRHSHPVVPNRDLSSIGAAIGDLNGQPLTFGTILATVGPERPLTTPCVGICGVKLRV